MAETIGRGPRIGARLAAERNRLGWSQQQLAIQAGVERTWIASLEAGNTGDPGAERLFLVSRALGVPLDYLISGQLPDDELPPEKAAAARRLVRNLSLDELSWLERGMGWLVLRGPRRQAAEPPAAEDGDAEQGDRDTDAPPGGV